MIPACMGGWCGLRNRCMQHLTPHRADVVERLCEKGAETPVPVLTRPETVQCDGPKLEERHGPPD